MNRLLVKPNGNGRKEFRPKKIFSFFDFSGDS